MEDQERCNTFDAVYQGYAVRTWELWVHIFGKCSMACIPELSWTNKARHQMCRPTTPIPSGGLCDMLPYYPT